MAARHRAVNAARARWLVAVAVAVLAIATVLLVVLALRSVQPPADTGEVPPEPSFSSGPKPTPSASSPVASGPVPSGPGTSSPVPTPTAGVGYPRAEARFLSIGSGGWWRATAGRCGATVPLVERSVDEGRTWTDVTPNYRGIGEVASLDAFAGSEAQMVAAMGTACDVQALRTFTQGRYWQPYPDVLATSRYLDPADPASVVVPGGEVAAPCAEPVALRATGDVVAVHCAGSVSALGADRTWQALPVTDAVALAISDGTVLTAAPTAGCSGVAVTRWSGTGFATSTLLGCAADVDPAAPTALAAANGGAVLWSGAAVVPVG